MEKGSWETDVSEEERKARIAIVGRYSFIYLDNTTNVITDPEYAHEIANRQVEIVAEDPHKTLDQAADEAEIRVLSDEFGTEIGEKIAKDMQTWRKRMHDNNIEKIAATRQNIEVLRAQIKKNKARIADTESSILQELSHIEVIESRLDQ